MFSSGQTGLASLPARPDCHPIGMGFTAGAAELNCRGCYLWVCWRFLLT